MGFFDDDEKYQRELRERKVKSAKLLGKWVTVMFWLQVVSVVAGVFDSDVFERIPMIYWAGTILGYGIMIANSVILIKLKEVEDWFGKAGVCYLVSGLSGIVIALLLLGGATAIGSTLSIAMMIVEIRGNYDECTGYEVVLSGEDDDLSAKWARQWKLELICVVSIIVSMVVLFVGALTGGGILTILAGFVTLAVAIGAFVLGIMRMVYMYRTAELFRNYRPEEVEIVAEQDAF